MSNKLLKLIKNIKEVSEPSFAYLFLLFVYVFCFYGFSVAFSRERAKKVFRRLRIGFFPVRLRLKNRISLMHFLSDYGMFDEIAGKDVYMLKSLKKGCIVVDAGANVGLVSLIAAKKARKVYSFEPCSENFRILEKNARENNMNNIFLYRAALSSRKGTAKLYLHSPETHTLSEGKPSKRYEIVKTTKIDCVIPQHEIIDFLKIDVEGAELDVIKGAAKTLGRTNAAAIELSEFCSHDEIKKLLEEKGFSCMKKKGLLIAKRKKACLHKNS